MEYKKFTLNNRKFLGSKHRLKSFIVPVIKDRVSKIPIFIDAFAGTGSIVNQFTGQSKLIINDLLFCNYVILKAFFCNTSKNVNINKIYKYITILNNLPPSPEGYVTASFGNTYFTASNAQYIDTIREKIENLYIENLCTLQEKCILLTSLLYAVDKVANTAGQYDAFLKNIHSKTTHGSSKHIRSADVHKKISLNLPDILFNSNTEVYNEDINKIISKISGTVLYLDPPYNHRQYIDNYHVLENIARWEKPVLYGKTKKFNRDHLKSDYSKKEKAFTALNKLILQANAEHIFLSYNNEGILSKNEIITILIKRGKTMVYEQEYNVFGNGAGRAKNRKTIELLFHCEVNKAIRQNSKAE